MSDFTLKISVADDTTTESFSNIVVLCDTIKEYLNHGIPAGDIKVFDRDGKRMVLWTIGTAPLVEGVWVKSRRKT